MYVSHQIGLISKCHTVVEEDEGEVLDGEKADTTTTKTTTDMNGNCTRMQYVDTEENENDDSPAKPVPYQKWEFTICNLLQAKVFGENNLLSGMKTNKSSVFKVRLGGWRIMVCDHLGIASLLDTSRVKRLDGTCALNPRMLRGYTPCQLSVDKTHDMKKEFLMNFFKDATDGLSVKHIAETVQSEFEKMAKIKFASAAEAELFDFEYVMKKAIVNVIFFVFLGEYLPDPEFDPKLVYQWRERYLDSSMLNTFLSFVSFTRHKSITNKIFKLLENTLKMREIKTNSDLTEKQFDELMSEIVHAIVFIATGAIKQTIMASLLCYIRLSLKDKRLIEQDAKTFFRTSNEDLETILPTLKHVHAFYMEVLRLHPPVPKFFRRATTDFVMRSTSGNFQIHNGDLICAYPFVAQRDARLFDYPNKFILNRCAEKTEKHNFAYGGLHGDGPASDNYKCVVQSLSNDIVKIFILFFTKCSITPSEMPVYTGCAFETYEITKQPPLKVMSFRYER